MNHPVPRKPGIIHNDMDLAVAELRRPLHQRRDVAVVQDVADDGERAVCAGGVDFGGGRGGFLYFGLVG